MKDELGGTIMTEFVAFRPKSYSYLMEGGNNDKKAKATKKCVIKRRLAFNGYKKCLLNNKTILKSQQRLKNEAHNGYNEQINKIALSVMMIKYCKLLIELHHTHMVQVLGKYAKQNC